MIPMSPTIVTFRIPAILRDVTSGVGEVSIKPGGGTVNDAVNSLEKTFPGIRARLLDNAGRLRRFVHVYVNEDDVRTLRGMATPVPQDALISIIPAAVGG